MTGQDGSASITDVADEGDSGVFSNPSFRGLWVANVLSAPSLGTGRFVFVWLVGDLTEWDPAVAILGLFMGLPALVLSPAAGALADRVPARRLGVGLLCASCAMFAVTAILTSAGLMTVPIAVICGLGSAVPSAGTMPLFQSIVPVVVPHHHLLRAVAFQNMGMNTALIVGSFIAGLVISIAGAQGGFWLLVITSSLAALRLATMNLPATAPGAGTPRKGAIREGMRFALFTQPLRSLLTLSLVMGLCVSSAMLMLAEIARDILDVGSVRAGLLASMIGLGLMSGSLLIASIRLVRPGLVLVVVASSSIGMGPLLLGLSQSYAFSMVVGFLWGAGGGTVTALLRALIQEETPPALMGRMMGISALAHHGAFPVSSVILFVLVRITDLQTTLVISGALGTAAIASQAIRPHIRGLGYPRMTPPARTPV